MTEPESTASADWEVRKEVRYSLCCTVCGCRYRSSSPKLFPQEVEKVRPLAERYGCSYCANRAKVAALPPHHAHHEHNPDWPYPGSGTPFCCARVQFGGIGLRDCEECGELFPCPTARAAAALPLPVSREEPNP